ncbi:EamA family transporter RarD [Massilia sp. W12]|uniref:EamA family transporter RarD n=1 Tax=Massilia sp. W12 TaxID=3126507 RepID=UPI0030CBB961
MRKGMLYAASAFFCWGLFPLYFKQLQQIPALEMLAHRMLWSLLFVLLVLGALRRWSWLREVAGNRKTMLTFFCSAALLAFNWFLYVWAVNNGHVIESSLGYFINPLVNVMFGFLLLKERLRPAQWAAIGVAACGVLWLTVQGGHLPWIALCLAGSFATYGLLRKTAPLGALEGLSIETMLMLPLALGYLAWLSAHAQNSFMQVSAETQIWMALAGPITAIPLLLFAAAARRIPLSMLGLFQYIGPSLQLLLGIFLFHEAFNLPRFIGFAIIWSALALYTAEGFWHKHRSAA